MKILLTNDDGIDAPGLLELWHSVTLALGDRVSEIVVVAPDRGRSECSHSVTGGRPLRIQNVREGWFSVDGTPADCVRVAITTLIDEPAFVFSGINAGANLGVNLMVSGTVAAAREAAVHGIPSIAISHYRRPDVPKTWEHARVWVAETIRAFVAESDLGTNPSGLVPLWNVNLPAIDPSAKSPAVVECPVDRCPLIRSPVRDGDLVSFELDFHNRPRAEGSDVDQCFSGKLTISKLSPHASL